MSVSITPGKPAELLPSTVDMVVDWMKADPTVAALSGGRISSTLPMDKDDIIYPWLTVSRVVGLSSVNEAALDTARVTFNVWGGVTTSGAPDWPDSDVLMRAVEHAIRTTHRVKIDGKGTIIGAAQLEGIQQLVDPDTNGSRWWMDAVIVAIPE